MANKATTRDGHAISRSRRPGRAAAAKVKMQTRGGRARVAGIKGNAAKKLEKPVPPEVAVLFAMPDSVYKTFPECDVWDEARDALKYAGNLPVVAHPPCRLWGKLAHMSTAPESEKELARFAVRQVQRCGGVLEHPLGSRLWDDMGLPAPFEEDAMGFTGMIPQYLLGHKAEKKTLLYVSGLKKDDLPPAFGLLDLLFTRPTHYVATSRRGLKGVFCTEWERKATPPKFARWLVSLAKLCRKL